MWSPDNLPQNHPQTAHGRIGVLLVNLGTPDATDYWAMRRYLKEFLSDRRVIEVPRLIWWFILNCIILTKRPKSSGEAYKSIWDKDRDDSPLRIITESQVQKLSERLNANKDDDQVIDGGLIIIDYAMRYGNPSIADKMSVLQAKGCDRIVIFPLYPQYAAATTATVIDKVADYMKAQRWQPTLRFVPPYYDDPAYIDALASTLQDSLNALDFEPEKILASFHGIPKSYFEKGDPYHCHCQKTARLLREKLGWNEEKLMLTFQSRFGKEEWLQPYTDKTVEKLAMDNIKNLAVVTPGFAADCVETLEEIVEENGEIFYAHGGENFALIPCLNDQAASIDMLEVIIKRELQGWV